MQKNSRNVVLKWQWCRFLDFDFQLQTLHQKIFSQTWLHSCLGTELHCCLGTLEHCCLGTVRHCCLGTLLHCCSGTLRYIIITLTGGIGHPSPDRGPVDSRRHMCPGCIVKTVTTELPASLLFWVRLSPPTPAGQIHSDTFQLICQFLVNLAG